MTLRYARVWPLVVVVLALLFAQLGPEPTRHMPWPLAWLTWTLHIGIGLALAVGATRLLGGFRESASLHPWLRLTLGGLLGSLAFAPLALGFDALFPLPAESADDVLDRWESGGGPLAVLAQWLQLAPTYLPSWLLLNLVPLAPAVIGADARKERENDAPVDVNAESSSLAADSIAVTEPATQELATAFFARLPAAIGRDIVRIDADLHYLHVRTTLGRATVLGSLAEIEAALPAEGVRVHRSHWIAFAHLRRVSKSAKGWACELRGGERVPISRRRIAEVRERLGTGFVLDPMA